MSAETMSPGPSVATVSAPLAGGVVSGEMSFNSFSGPSAYGGNRMAGLDQAAFSETFQMPSPSPNSFEGGKFNPDFSALGNTQTLWQAPEAPEIPEGGKAIASISAFENTEILWQASEVNKDTPFETIVIPEISLSQIQPEIEANSKSEPVLSAQEKTTTNLTQKEMVLEPKLMTDGLITPDEMVRQNAITKVREAIKYEEVKMGTGEPEKEMEKLAVETEEKPTIKTEIITRQIDEKDKEEKEKQPKPNPKPPKLYFQHDTNADETRKTAGLNAIEKVSEEIADEKIVEVTGQDIAEQMPNPQPKEVKSEIAKDKDGSYESLIRQLETAGIIYSASEAKGLIEKLVNENHAVRKNSVLISHEASENEVKKVLGGQSASAEPLTSP